jgi:alkylhydroperoxidase family enzyme
MMARIRLVDPAEARGRTKEIFEEIEAVRGQGRVPNLMRAYAHHLPSLESNWDRMKHLLTSGRLPRRTKEAIGLTMAALHKCGY